MVDPLFDENEEYREFWQFAAEMPDVGLPRNDAANVDESRWIALFTPLYDGSVKDAKNRPIRSTEFIYRSWPRMEATTAGRQIIEELYRAKETPQELLEGFIPLVKGELSGDTGTFHMGEGEDAHKETVMHFCLHRFCITNVQYELFDPRHKERRWGYADQHDKGDCLHPIAVDLNSPSADDTCPVVRVSWYDAMCFSRWLGTYAGRNEERYEILLPTEIQWEYACRAGQRTPYTFADTNLGQICTPERCNFWFADWIDHPDWDSRMWRQRPGTLPVDGKLLKSWSELPFKGVKGRNRWGFFQMHGNVWEWCQGETDLEGIAFLRGGSWLGKPTADANGLEYREDEWDGLDMVDLRRCCRSNHRLEENPSTRRPDIGFRLAAVVNHGLR